MNKKLFIAELDRLLKRIPDEERQDIMQDFEEHFAFGLEAGKSEEEIANSLGSPNQIAKEMMANYHLDIVADKMTTGNILRAVWAVIGLGFFNLIIVLGPFIALVSLLIAGWLTGLSFVISPILNLVNVLFAPDTFMLFDLFFTLLLAGIGLLLVVLMFYLTRVLLKGFVRYLKFNVNFVKGGMNHA